MTEWLLLKRGLYYRPNDCGYTGIRDHAGRYSVDEAKARIGHGISMVMLEAAPEFSEACFDDLARDHLRKQRDDLTSANTLLHNLITNRDDTIVAQRAMLDRAHEDNVKLRGEVERLTRELSNLTSDYRALLEAHDSNVLANEALRAALHDIATSSALPADRDQAWEFCCDVAREALALETSTP